MRDGVKLAVLDYGSGNLASAVRALARAAGPDDTVDLTSDVDRARECDGLLVPGVGAYAACMAGLTAIGGDDLVRARVEAGRPTLGVCVGMQVLFAAGDEHGEVTRGVGVWPATVSRLRPDDPRTPIPHMGWNTVTPPAGSRLFEGIVDERFYFVHSYAAHDLGLDAGLDAGAGDPRATWCDYAGDRFVAAVEDGALAATQFHPEKSGAAGLRLLTNWVADVRSRTRSLPGAQVISGA